MSTPIDPEPPIRMGATVAVTYHATMRLRWLEKPSGFDGIANGTVWGPAAPFRELQQAWRGDDGSVRWAAVEVVSE